MQLSQEERTLGGLVHLGVIFGWLGFAFDLVILLVYMPKSKYVFAHAKQALGLWVIWYLLRLAVGTLTGGLTLAAGLNPVRLMNGGFIGTMLIGGLLMLGLGVTVLVMVILAMIKGFNGQDHRYPVIGDLIASIGGEQMR